jgi:hypothetical protein
LSFSSHLIYASTSQRNPSQWKYFSSLEWSTPRVKSTTKQKWFTHMAELPRVLMLGWAYHYHNIIAALQAVVICSVQVSLGHEITSLL